MRKDVVIAIGGPAGSGKTTYARHIAERMGLRYVSAGFFFRKIAEERGLSLVELNKLAEEKPEIDIQIDRMTLETAIQGNAVIEGHLVPWVVKDYADLLIYVTAPLGERVKRIAKREHRDWKDVLIETAKREFSHALRFKKYYGLDLCDLSIFDYVIDTSNISVNDVTKIIDHILQVHFGAG